jgi:MFS family permease
VLAVMAFSPHPSVGLLYAIAVVGGILLAFDNPLRRSFVTEMVSHDDLPNAVSLYSSLVNISRVFGPALAGVLVVTVGFGWCFVIDAVSYVFVLGALKLMRTSELRRTPPAPRRRGQVRQAIRYTWAIPDLRTTFVMLAIVCVLGYNLNVVFPLVVERSLGGSDGAFTLLYVCFSVGAVIASLAVARRPAVSVMRIVVGCAAYGVTMLGLAVAPNLGVAFAVAVLIGASSILYTTTTTAIVQTRADPQMHGRLLSLQVILLVGFAPINGPFLGYLADLVGPRSPAALGGVAALLAAAWGWTHLA